MNDRIEAIEHIVTSTNYWKGENFDHFSYPSNLGLESSFDMAVKHVKHYHYPELTDEDIEVAKNRCGL